MVSIQNNSNKVIGTTNENWESVRIGSSIRFGADKIFYEIANKKKEMYIKQFLMEGSKFKINSDTENYFLPNDLVKVSYKQHGLNTIQRIVGKGKDYRQGDVVSISTGEPASDNETGNKKISKIKVMSVDEKGGITNFSIVEEGCYIKAPDVVSNVFGGSGDGAILKTDYKVLEKRAILDRVVSKIRKEGSKTILELNYPITKFVIEGKVSVEKWELYLSNPYVGEAALAANYELLRDYAPNSTIPLMSAHSSAPEQIYNLAMRRVATRLFEADLKIKALEEKLEKLNG